MKARQVKDNKINMLLHQYELLKMHDNKIIIPKMHERFTKIKNELNCLDKKYSEKEMCLSFRVYHEVGAEGDNHHGSKGYG